MILWVRGVPRARCALLPLHTCRGSPTLRDVATPAAGTLQGRCQSLSPPPSLCPQASSGPLPSLSPFSPGPGKRLRGILVGFSQREVKNKRETALLGGCRELSPPFSSLSVLWANLLIDGTPGPGGNTPAAPSAPREPATLWDCSRNGLPLQSPVGFSLKDQGFGNASL